MKKLHTRPSKLLPTIGGQRVNWLVYDQVSYGLGVTWRIRAKEGAFASYKGVLKIATTIFSDNRKIPEYEIIIGWKKGIFEGYSELTGTCIGAEHLRDFLLDFDAMKLRDMSISFSRHELTLD
ncbi:hypothetical protein [Spirosoma foliorum]|uniref:Uncharacterized protein n=1 Tax=Spirosoma foliorum TaxID=2710596 RepID=A0A7G5H2I3_9BACT|nr:hypothetical protein [Spirosoma foliorum]QMW05325.1 hypothetical protein H3H32_10770 [Spirosoma foliorum]